VKTFRVGVDHLGELLGRRVLKLFNFVIAAAQIRPVFGCGKHLMRSLNICK
jgi:hypothetical protein